MTRLTKNQWSKIAPILEEIRPKKKCNHEHLKASLEGVLWQIVAGSSWSDMPRRFRAPATCFKLYKELYETGRWDKVLVVLAEDLKISANIDISSCFEHGKHKSSLCHAKLFGLLKEYSNERDWRFYTLFLFINPYALTQKVAVKKTKTVEITPVYSTFNLKALSVFSERNASI